jgi:hypothetical protein
MTSRILQEDSGLILTQASEPIINENFIGANSFSTGSPVVQTSAITQVHAITATDVTSGIPTVGSSALTQAHGLSCTNITTGVVSIQAATIAQDHDLTSDLIVTGAAIVSSTSLSQLYDLSAVSFITSSPVVANATLTENETNTAVPILTGVPEVNPTAVTQNNVLSAKSILTGRPNVEDARDPNLILEQEIDQMFGGWQRRTYEVPDGRLVQSEREIQSTYGDVVSIDKKAKSLLKFGKSAPLTTNSLQTVWTVGGNEVYISDDGITHISSSSASDTQEIRVEGHTISGNDLTFVVQTVTLSGQTSVALTTGLARVSRISNNNGTELVGRVVVYEDTEINGGIPTDANKIHIDIPLGFQQSFKAATSFSKEDYYVMTGFYGAVSAKQSAAVDFYVEVKEPDGVFLQKACFTASSSGGNSDISLDPAIIIPKNSDVRVRCETSDNNAVVFGIFKGYLAKVTG